MALVVALDALSFFGAGVTLLFLHIPSPQAHSARQAGAARRSLWADMREGALFIWDRRPMLWLLGTFTVINFLTVPVIVFQPLLVKYNLATTSFEATLALVSTVSSVGGVLGGVLVSTWGGLKRKRVYGVVVSALLVAICNAVLGLSATLSVMAAMAFLSRMMFPVMDAHSQAIWQSQTPRELQGRVFAVRRTIAQFSGPLGAAAAGALGGWIAPGTLVTVLSITLGVLCLVQLFNPYLLRADDKEWLDRLAVEASARRVQG